MLAVTHIDNLKDHPARLDEQCKLVKETILRKLEQQGKLQNEKILPLTLLNNGDSIRVDCLGGEGISELRQALIHATIDGIKWYGEILPSGYMDLRRNIMDMRVQKPLQSPSQELAGMSSMVPAKGKRRGWMNWHTYYELASKQCKLDDTNIEIATKFLHETGMRQQQQSFDNIMLCLNVLF
jgi:hypothetical protein